VKNFLQQTFNFIVPLSEVDYRIIWESTISLFSPTQDWHLPFIKFGVFFSFNHVMLLPKLQLPFRLWINDIEQGKEKEFRRSFQNLTSTYTPNQEEIF